MIPKRPPKRYRRWGGPSVLGPSLLILCLSFQATMVDGDAPSMLRSQILRPQESSRSVGGGNGGVAQAALSSPTQEEEGGLQYQPAKNRGVGQSVAAKRGSGLQDGMGVEPAGTTLSSLRSAAATTPTGGAYGSDYEEEAGGIFETIRRHLMAGANCVMAGGGSVVPFERCMGCSLRDAYRCIEDMRSNRTGTVPKGCSIRDIDLQGKHSCCPRFQNPKKPWTIVKTSSAYPDAFTCLAEVGCMGSVAWAELKNECSANRCNSAYACKELQSPARRGAEASRLGLVLPALLAVVLVLRT